jgi:flagellar secretion chaperone FliS
MDAKLDTYKTVDTLGKSPLDLVLQVYDGAIRAFTQARESYARQDAATGYEELERAKRFLMHLYTTLDFAQGGEVADRLGQLYVFVLNQTNLAQATHDQKRIDQSIAVLRNLRTGWAGLRGQASASTTEAPVLETAGQFEASA